MEGPLSSYSPLVIHICWNVVREARIEPPIHTEYFLSGGAMILTLTEGGAMVPVGMHFHSAVEECPDEPGMLHVCKPKLFPKGPGGGINFLLI